ncbi:hypothetical protein PACTADRAFT_21356, partial [Pachysolen tannophilus NRRL Y-2460]
TYKRFNNHVTRDYAFLSNPNTAKYIGIVVIFSGGFYLTHLDEAPVSGRKRFICVSESIEKRIGQYTYNQIMSQYRRQLLPSNHPTTLKVKRIMERIISASGTEEDPLVNWEIHVINSNDSPNAFVIPGGKVFVFSSLLPIAKNDDGLATILAHEFSHQLARHSAENLSKAPIYSLLSLVLYTITGSDTLNNLLIRSVIAMPASREMETEADYIGLMIMSQACFDPHEAPKVWQRFSDYESKTGNRVPEFLSTHPATKRRLENMNKWLPEANMKREASNCGAYGAYGASF